MKKITLLMLCFVISSQVLAEPITYVIDGMHTFPRFSYSHLGFSTQVSRFDNTKGKIVIDREAKTGSVDVSIETDSVNTGSILFNQHIQSSDFLDTSHYPKATFISNKFVFDEERPISVEGTLTLKGISKPVTIKLTSFQCMPHPMLKIEACGGNASTIIKRSDFNMAKYAPKVSDELNIDIAIEAIKE